VAADLNLTLNLPAPSNAPASATPHPSTIPEEQGEVDGSEEAEFDGSEEQEHSGERRREGVCAGVGSDLSARGERGAKLPGPSDTIRPIASVDAACWWLPCIIRRSGLPGPDIAARRHSRNSRMSQNVF
jgi:hypothetical protein